MTQTFYPFAHVFLTFLQIAITSLIPVPYIREKITSSKSLSIKELINQE